MVGFTEEKEEQDRVEIAVVGGGGRLWWQRMEVAGEVVEGREEVAGDEEGFFMEGEGMEVLEGEGEKGGGGEEGGETAVVVEGTGED